jgi:hypothetical protein
LELGSYFLFLQEQTKDIIIITEQNSSIGWGGVNSRAVSIAMHRYWPLLWRELL